MSVFRSYETHKQDIMLKLTFYITLLRKVKVLSHWRHTSTHIRRHIFIQPARKWNSVVTKYRSNAEGTVSLNRPVDSLLQACWTLLIHALPLSGPAAAAVHRIGLT